MSEPTWKQKAGATPGKLALVGCLAVGFVFVLWKAQSGGADETRVSKSPPQSVVPQKVAVTKKVLVPKIDDTEQAKAQLQHEWPTLPLETVVKKDPFAMPSWYLATMDSVATSVDEAAKQSEQLLEKLRKEQAKIIVISHGERIATIGNESYRVGDAVAGFEVTEINRDGVVLTEIER